MSIDVTDLRSTIIPRSDQLNAEQLLGGPMIITVTEVRVGGGEEQPVVVHYENDGGRPFKPCKTMRKVLIHAWGPDGTQWVGKSMELFNEPTVKFGGELVGGIRIARLSDIPREIRVSLTATKGKKTLHEIGLLKMSAELTAALAAIEAASGRESMAKAKVLAEKLKAPADIAAARGAYAKKVAELKAKAAPPPAAPDHSALIADYRAAIDAAADAETAGLSLDEARDLLPAEAHALLVEHWRARWPDA